jgi:hypothetical protein
MFHVDLERLAVALYVSAIVLSLAFGCYNQFVMIDNIQKEKRWSAYLLGSVNFRPDLFNERGNKARVRFNISAVIFALLVGVPILLMVYNDVSSVLSYDKAVPLADKKFKDYCREKKDEDCDGFSRYSIDRYKIGWLVEYKNHSNAFVYFLVHDNRRVEVYRSKEDFDKSSSGELYRGN